MSQAFRPTSFLRPKEERQLSELLKKFGERARVIAGGTGIYEVAHRGLMSEVEILIDISGLNLSYIIPSSDSLKIGAATTMSDLINSNVLSSHLEFQGILDALRAIQPLQVKNVATIGGSICSALPFFDLPVSLLSLDARVRLAPTGRMMKLSEFFLGYFSVALDAGEFVKEVELPFLNVTASAFQKFGLTHDDWALLNCGVSLSLDNANRIHGPSIIFGGGVGDKPIRASATETALSGVDFNDSSKIRGVFFENVPLDVQPTTDIRASSEYRLTLAKVLGARTTIQACSRLSPPGRAG